MRDILFEYVNTLGIYLEDRDYFSYGKHLQEIKGTYSNKRCFIIGNGPSLKKTDLSKLADEVTFGLNRIYLLKDEMGFDTTFYVAVNTLLIKQFGHEISSIKSLKFINWDAKEFIAPAEKTIFLKPKSNVEFSTNLQKGIWFDSTVTYVALQIAYFLGFEQAILVGVDHNFKTKGPPDKTVIAKGQDLNHFSPDYFGKGVKWQLPDLKGSELAYNMAKWQYERDHRKILDATVGGKLDIFPKVEYESLFSKK